MNTNLQWLKELFSQPHLSNIPLIDTNVVKWFAYKRGKAMYNSHQIELAPNLGYKLFVLETLFDKLIKPDSL
jgi:hypothetical protein